MKINDAVARLVRAGDENSRMWQKIHEAIDEVARELAGHYPEGVAHRLTADFEFVHWSPGSYKLQCDSGCMPMYVLTQKSKPHRGVLHFCEAVNNGLLDSIASQLEEQNGLIRAAVDRASRFTDRVQ